LHGAWRRVCAPPSASTSSPLFLSPYPSPSCADIVAYAGPSELPRAARPNQIAIDKAKEAVLLPLFGSLVPFHVSTIKSVVKSEEGAKAFLRLNFYAPGAAPGKECSPAMQAAMLRNPASIYVRTLNFMSRDHRNMNNVVAMIKAMQVRGQGEQRLRRAGLRLLAGCPRALQTPRRSLRRRNGPCFSPMLCELLCAV
jgi:nucleosome binding factor SPN SPT16 subunit